MERPWGQVAGRRQVSQSWTSLSISGWDNLSPIFTAEWQAMVARMRSSRRWPGSDPLMAESASLKAPATSLSARVARPAVTRPARGAGVGPRGGRERALEAAGHVPVRERGDDGRHAHGAGAERLDLEAVDGELFEARCGAPPGAGGALPDPGGVRGAGGGAPGPRGRGGSARSPGCLSR